MRFWFLRSAYFLFSSLFFFFLFEETGKENGKREYLEEAWNFREMEFHISRMSPDWNTERQHRYHHHHTDHSTLSFGIKRFARTRIFPYSNNPCSIDKNLLSNVRSSPASRTCLPFLRIGDSLDLIRIARSGIIRKIRNPSRGTILSRPRILLLTQRRSNANSPFPPQYNPTICQHLNRRSIEPSKIEVIKPAEGSKDSTHLHRTN